MTTNSSDKVRVKCLDDYILILDQELGKGAFGSVYAGFRKADKKIVAIKVLNRQQMNDHQIANVKQEINIMRQLDHPNIVKLYAFKRSKHNDYLIMELCKGGNLEQYIKKKGKLNEKTVKRFTRHIACALQALRGKSITHRDLKPQNILLSKLGDDAVLKIADFGLATKKDLATTFCGSPYYMAPERFVKNAPHDATVDLWSVGLIIYEMVTGRRLFEADRVEKLLDEHNKFSIPEGSLNCSKECENLIRSLIRRESENRISFEEFFNHDFLKPDDDEVLNDNLTLDFPLSFVPGSLSASSPEKAGDVQHPEYEVSSTPNGSPDMETPKFSGTGEDLIPTQSSPPYQPSATELNAAAHGQLKENLNHARRSSGTFDYIGSSSIQFTDSMTYQLEKSFENTLEALIQPNMLSPNFIREPFQFSQFRRAHETSFDKEMKMTWALAECGYLWSKTKPPKYKESFVVFIKALERLHYLNSILQTKTETEYTALCSRWINRQISVILEQSNHIRQQIDVSDWETNISPARCIYEYVIRLAREISHREFLNEQNDSDSSTSSGSMNANIHVYPTSASDMVNPYHKSRSAAVAYERCLLLTEYLLDHFRHLLSRSDQERLEHMSDYLRKLTFE